MSMSGRTLCFGGTFNPIHHGHLICARFVAESVGFDRVLLIPSAQPPHKAGDAIVAASHRLAMCRLAVAGEALFEVDDLELQRSGPSYTVDTAGVLKKRGMERVYWLVGADMVRYLPTWHDSERLRQEVDFVVLERPGSVIEWDSMPPSWRALRQNVVSAPLVDMSATEIRRRVKENRSIAYLTPEPVVRYIREHGLYSE
jgi:nicotinate-nucleotide adenylyltransferase